MKDIKGMSEHYIASCRNEFWQKVFQLELEYLTRQLKGCRDILSVGCGPAIIEGGLARLGLDVTGLGKVFDHVKTWNPPKHPGHAAVALRVEEVYSGPDILC
jgi:2-polyprenyl-3-methyl-5-hydroxy-6-metoxy-1,4-benzoquinol methylase